MTSKSKSDAAKIEALDRILKRMDVASGQKDSNNAVVNIAALLEFQEEIERELGDSVTPGDYFQVFADRVMKGGAVVLTDESTTGHVVEVEFCKKVIF